jgi:ElaB/YqjD/DUF883 family membrane-anchored ribosome-binding protein
MLEPASSNFSGGNPISEAAEKIAEETAEKAQIVADAATEKARAAVFAAERLRQRLYTRWQQLNERVASEASERIPQFRQELRDDAGYIADRARYYHETRPLSALGAVAAGAFLFGMAIGFGRH